MSRVRGRHRWVAVGSLFIVIAAAAPPAASPSGQQRTEAASSVSVPVQGSGEPTARAVSGAPTPPDGPTAAVSARARTGRPAVAPAADPLALRLRALATAEGEATVELDGARQVVRPGSRLGADVVKSVGPGRIVLERLPEPGRAGGGSLVIVTFDAGGRARPRHVWTADPMAPAAPEPTRQ